MYYAYQLRIERVVDRFSLTSVQLSVCEFLDQTGATVKGISLFGLGVAPTGIFERVALLSRDGVSQLITFIGKVLQENLPANFCADAGHRKKLRWSIRQFVPSWHEGGAYMGRLNLGWLALGILHPASEIAVTRKTLERLASCLRNFYEIDA